MPQCQCLKNLCVGEASPHPLASLAPSPASAGEGLFSAPSPAPRERVGVRAYSRTVLRRSALPITLTDDSAIAAAAITGDNRIPNTGYSTPAAIGTPAAL